MNAKIFGKLESSYAHTHTHTHSHIYIPGFCDKDIRKTPIHKFFSAYVSVVDWDEKRKINS